MLESHHILVVDPDPTFLMSVSLSLELTKRFVVSRARSAQLAERALAQSEMGFDAILIESALPDGDGIALCDYVRDTYPGIQILLLTSSDDDAGLVRALQGGVDDFVRKPLRGNELLVRLTSRLRSAVPAHDAPLTFGRFIYHPATKVLVDLERNSRMMLAEKEGRLLKHLYSRSGQTVSRTALLHSIWGYSTASTTHTVETHVYRLRQKIEDDPGRPTVIVTERGGYRFAGSSRPQSVNSERRVPAGSEIGLA